jgi:dTDP-4-amino-4,6-dideoxygalactose transaminase
LYPVLVKTDRRRFFDYLRDNDVMPQVHYIPVHYLPYYKERFNFGDLSNAEDFYEREISLPMFAALTDDEQGHVIDLIKRYAP